MEKEEFEGELKNLQDSLLAMKKQMPAPDANHSLAEVIHMSAMTTTQIMLTVWVKCSGSSALFYSMFCVLCVFFIYLFFLCFSVREASIISVIVPAHKHSHTIAHLHAPYSY